MMKLSEIKENEADKYIAEWASKQTLISNHQTLVMRNNFLPGFDAGAKAVMEEADKLIEALRTAKEQACGCCNSSEEVGEHCQKAINIWTKFKEGNNEPG